MLGSYTPIWSTTHPAPSVLGEVYAALIASVARPKSGIAVPKTASGSPSPGTAAREVARGVRTVPSGEEGASTTVFRVSLWSSRCRLRFAPLGTAHLEKDIVIPKAERVTPMSTPSWSTVAAVGAACKVCVAPLTHP